MKKLAFILIMVLFIATQSYSKDFYAQGVENYKLKNYIEAAKNFEYALKINPKDINARYYLAQAYINLKLISEAKEQYSKIILLAPDSNAALLSQKGLSLICQAEKGEKSNPSQKSNQIGENYLQYVLADGKIRKWVSMPISVYIEPKRYKKLVKEAFEQWQNSTQGIVKFIFSTNPNSQITVSFTDKLESSTGKESYVAGYSKPYYKNGNFVKSEISILTIDPIDKKSLPDNFIYFSTLHEIGHSLGFNGHSPDSNDVMYASSTEPKEILSTRDINTMKLLYTIDDSRLASLNTKGKDLKLQQLLDYVKQFPDKSVGWTNLADYYSGKGIYSEAIKNYQKSLSIDSSKAETYNLIGSTYLKAGDINSAYRNLKRACELDRNNDFYIYQFVKACTTDEQKAMGRKYLQDFIRNNPDKSNSSLIKSLLNQ